MEEFKAAQDSLDKLFDKLKYDRRTGENRSERRQREKKERREAKLARLSGAKTTA